MAFEVGVPVRLCTGLTHELRTDASVAETLKHGQTVTAIRTQYNENAKQIERTWGGGVMGVKSQAKTKKLDKAIAKEAAKKALM